jgi:hypothetical protein
VVFSETPVFEPDFERIKQRIFFADRLYKLCQHIYLPSYGKIKKTDPLRSCEKTLPAGPPQGKHGSRQVSMHYKE